MSAIKYMVHACAAIAVLSSPIIAQSYDVKLLGNGSVFLYEEELGAGYANFWSYQEKIGSASSEAFILGEGKSVEFSGIISMNCSNNNYYWRVAENWGDAGPASASVVPSIVIESAFIVHCAMPIVADAFKQMDSVNRQRLQQSLYYLGLYDHGFDGLWGRGTYNALVEMVAFYGIDIKNKNDALKLFASIEQMEEYEGFYPDR